MTASVTTQVSSGPIRQRLGPAHKRVADISVEDIRDNFNVPVVVGETTDQRISVLKERRDIGKKWLQRAEKALATFQRYFEKFQDLAITDKQEEDQFNTYCTSKNTDALLALMEDKQIDCNLAIQKVEEEIDQLQKTGLNATQRSKPEAKAMHLLMQDYTEILTKNKITSSSDEIGFNAITTKLERQTRAKDAQILIGSSFTESLINDTTHSYSDLIRECNFGGRDCGEKDFARLIDPIYGACYQFNSAGIYRASRAGASSGLKLLITIVETDKNGQTEFLPTVETRSARVLISGQNEPIFIDSFSLNAAVGYVNAFAIHMTTTNRLKQPYGICTDGMTEENTYYYGKKTVKYSMAACYRACYQKFIIDRCKCADPRYAKPKTVAFCTINDLDCISEARTAFFEDNTANFSSPYSNSTDSRYYSATTSSTIVQRNEKNKCKCKPSCHEVSYGTTASHSQFPASKYALDECAEWSSKGWRNQSNCISWYRENAMLLKIYFERMNHEVFTEVKAYSLLDASFDLGGQLGLWLGVSIISIIETFSLFIAMITFGCGLHSSRKNDKKKKNNQVVDIAHVNKG